MVVFGLKKKADDSGICTLQVWLILLFDRYWKKETIIVCTLWKMTHRQSAFVQAQRVP
jgi:hypothetical protein